MAIGSQCARFVHRVASVRYVGLRALHRAKCSSIYCLFWIALIEPGGCEEPVESVARTRPPNLQVPVPLGPLCEDIPSFQVIPRNGTTDAVSVIAHGRAILGSSMINRNIVIHTGENPFLSLHQLPTIGPAVSQNSLLRNGDKIVYHTGDFNKNSVIDAIGINRSSKIYFQSGLIEAGKWYDFSDPNFRPCSMQFVQDEENGENYLLLVGLSGELKVLKYREQHNGKEFPFYLDPIDANGMPIEIDHHIEYITRGGKLIAFSSCEALDENIASRSKEFENRDLDNDGSYDRITVEKNDPATNSNKEDRECEKFGESCAYIEWGTLTNDPPRQYLDIRNPALLASGNFISKSNNLDLAFTQSNTIVFFENIGKRKFKRVLNAEATIDYGHPQETIDEIRVGKFDDDGTDDLAVLKQRQGVVTFLLSGGEL